MGNSSLRYAQIVNELGLSPTHRQIIALVGRERCILDVGCSTGYLGQTLKLEAACIVDGVELDPMAAEVAKPYYRNIYVGSIEDPAFILALSQTYDVIIFADVLEHLSRPEQILAACANLLRPDGFALISMPNIAFWDVRRQLFFRGEWQYTETGILDYTHLRFYTFYSVRDLIAKARYRIVEQRVGISWLPFERGLYQRAIGKRLIQTHVFQHFKQMLVQRFPNFFALHTILKVVPQHARTLDHHR